VIDCHMTTAHLQSLGAREISRREFLAMLSELVNYPPHMGPWRFDHDLFD
jgi:leucyl/phenylalanyl-tRNA---protein transferase